MKMKLLEPTPVEEESHSLNPYGEQDPEKVKEYLNSRNDELRTAQYEKQLRKHIWETPGRALALLGDLGVAGDHDITEIKLLDSVSSYHVSTEGGRTDYMGIMQAIVPSIRAGLRYSEFVSSSSNPELGFRELATSLPVLGSELDSYPTTLITKLRFHGEEDAVSMFSIAFNDNGSSESHKIVFRPDGSVYKFEFFDPNIEKFIEAVSYPEEYIENAEDAKLLEYENDYFARNIRAFIRHLENAHPAFAEDIKKLLLGEANLDPVETFKANLDSNASGKLEFNPVIKS